VANPKKAEVQVSFGGDPYLLCFDMNAIAELEAALGKPVHKIFGNLAEEIGVSLMRRLLFHGLQKKHPNLTLTDIGEKMSFEEMGSYGEAIGRAISLSVSGKEPGERKMEESEKSDPPLPVESETVGTGTT